MTTLLQPGRKVLPSFNTNDGTVQQRLVVQQQPFVGSPVVV